MKWIGQHIWDYISRFRNDVYLEDVSTGTIASGGNLGLDSNNKIVKADTEAGELTIANAANNRVVTSLGGTDLDAESKFTWDQDKLYITSATAAKPSFVIESTNSSGDGGNIMFNTVNASGVGSDGDYAGKIQFDAENDNNELNSFAQIYTRIGSAADTDEAGDFNINATTGSNSNLLKRKNITTCKLRINYICYFT